MFTDTLSRSFTADLSLLNVLMSIPIETSDILSAIRPHLTSAVEPSIAPISSGRFNTSSFIVAPGLHWVIRIAPPRGAVFSFYERDMMRQEPGIHTACSHRQPSRYCLRRFPQAHCPRLHYLGATLEPPKRRGKSKVIQAAGDRHPGAFKTWLKPIL